jgi:tetratricopeptide (TPR) repeat protein
LGSQGRLAEAIEHFRQAIKLEPDTLVAHYNLGYALEMQGQLGEATAEYRQVLRIDPNHTESQRRLEIASAKQQNR